MLRIKIVLDYIIIQTLTKFLLWNGTFTKYIVCNVQQPEKKKHFIGSSVLLRNSNNGILGLKIW